MKVLVKDEQTKELLPFSHVCIESKTDGEKLYLLSNQKGEVEFKFKGKSIISISFLGYETLIDTLDKHADLFVYYLIPTTSNLSEVVVTGQSKPIKADQSIYEVKVLSSKTIQEKAPINLADLLNTELNVKIENDPSTGTSIKLQGMEGEQIKIMVDGVPIIGRLDGKLDLSQINLNNVDHVEIIEGPMSVIYGSNALGGVINLITKQNKFAKLKWSGDTYYESVGVYNFNTEGHLKGKVQGLDLSTGRHFFGGFDDDKTTRSMAWKPKEQYQATLAYQYFQKRFKTQFKSDLFKERLWDQGNLLTPYYETAIDHWFETWRFDNALKTNYQWTEFSGSDLLLSYSHYLRSKSTYIKDLTSLENKLSQDPLDNDTTVFGAYLSRGIYYYDRIDKPINLQTGFDINYENSKGKRILGQTQAIGDYAIFANLQWKINPYWMIQSGLRGVYNTKYNAPLTPSVHLKYQTEQWAFRASYGRGFRSPSLKELYLYFYDSNHQIEGNENLQAEYSHNISLSLNSDFKLFKKNWLWQVKGFYNQINNKITLVQVAQDNDLHYRNENIGFFENYGSAITLSVKWSSYVDFQIGASELARRDDEFKTNQFIFNTDFNSQLSIYALNRTLSIALIYKYIGRTPEYFYNTEGDIVLGYVEGYHDMNLNIGKQFYKNKLVLSAGVKNIFDNKRIGGVGSSGSTHGGGSTGNLVSWGRTFYLGLKFNLAKY